MITLIICSQSPVLHEELARNIDETIGVDYEVVHIDNSQKSYSIFEAYNKGVELAHGDYLCFMHEDIAFHSSDWGKVVVQLLSDKKVGLLGVAGAETVPSRGDWRFCKNSFLYVIQGHRTLGNPSIYYIDGIEWDTHQACSQVAVVDGCWFCIRRELFSAGKLRFDEENFNSFHLYDSDISMQVNKLGLKNYVCAGILVEHFSEGLYSHDFIKGLETFAAKWHEYLPYTVPGKTVDREEENRGEERLNRRIRDDEQVLLIKAYGNPEGKEDAKPPLSREAENLIEQSFYQYAKSRIKFARTDREARQALGVYLTRFGKRSKSLMWKFLYYRFLHHKKNQVIHIQSLNPQSFGV